jgi:hypothetical protein
MFYAVRSSDPTRVLSPRQLPTDHDCAVSIRGYQIDQPSHLPLALSPRSILHYWYNPRQGPPTIKTALDRSLHIT